MQTDTGSMSALACYRQPKVRPLIRPLGFFARIEIQLQWERNEFVCSSAFLALCRRPVLESANARDYTAGL
jgi:hypothetical protein